MQDVPKVHIVCLHSVVVTTFPDIAYVLYHIDITGDLLSLSSTEHHCRAPLLCWPIRKTHTGHHSKLSTNTMTYILVGSQCVGGNCTVIVKRHASAMSNIYMTPVGRCTELMPTVHGTDRRSSMHQAAKQSQHQSCGAGYQHTGVWIH